MEPGQSNRTDAAGYRRRKNVPDPYLRCAFNGAAQTALGVAGSALLAHSPQGCDYLVNNAFASQECDYMETMTLCTKLCVDEIVHGGEDLLARTIREAKDLPVSALFVISSCGPEIVGDDITAVCNELQPEVKFRLVPIPSPGFRGSQYRRHRYRARRDAEAPGQSGHTEGPRLRLPCCPACEREPDLGGGS